MELIKKQKNFHGKNWFRQKLKNCMAKNDFRETSIFQFIIRICEKKFEFSVKTFTFLAKLFSFKWRGVDPTRKSDKNIENEISGFTSYKKKKTKEDKQNHISLHIIISKITEKFALVILIIHY